MSRLAMYARFVAGMPAFLSQRITSESARATVSARLAARESNFLRAVRRHCRIAAGESVQLPDA